MERDLRVEGRHHKIDREYMANKGLERIDLVGHIHTSFGQTHGWCVFLSQSDVSGLGNHGRFLELMGLDCDIGEMNFENAQCVRPPE